MSNFLSGAIMICYLATGLFFVRFWKQTRDRLFLMFSFAFWLLGVNQLGFLFAEEGSAGRSYIYLIRLAAFILILIAVVDKNRTRQSAE
jgi:uncharacterized protein DUF5985